MGKNVRNCRPRNLACRTSLPSFTLRIHTYFRLFVLSTTQFVRQISSTHLKIWAVLQSTTKSAKNCFNVSTELDGQTSLIRTPKRQTPVSALRRCPACYPGASGGFGHEPHPCGKASQISQGTKRCFNKRGAVCWLSPYT